MTQTVFYPRLNDFCRTFLVANRQLSLSEVAEFPNRLKDEQRAIFEHLMLFDEVAFKVWGENIPVSFLLNLFDDYVFDALIEQKAFKFILWTPVVTFMVTDIQGIDPLQYGTVSSPAHSDPEKSLELGLSWKTPALSGKRRKHLIRTLTPLYESPPPELPKDAVNIVHSSYKSGKLGVFNFPPALDIRTLPRSERERLCKCASELLEYSYLTKARMTSFSNFEYFKLFNDSANKLRYITDSVEAFNQVAKLEGFPNLKTLCQELGDPFRKLSKLRVTRNAVRFREWLRTTSASDIDITREYVDEIADAKGFFETKKGKLIKAIGMTSISAGIGATIGGMEGALGGAGVAKVLEPAADFVLDLIDEFLIAGLTRGWSPRMFFDDLRRIIERKS